MKKQLIIIGILSIAAACILMALNLASDAPNRAKNGFQRKFISDAIARAEKAVYKNIFRTICGWDQQYIYYSSQIPGRIYRSGYDMQLLDTLKLDLPEIEKLVPLFNTFVDYPHISITGGNARVVIVGDLEKNTFTKHSVDTLFSMGYAFGGSGFMMKTINKDSFYMGYVKYDLPRETVHGSFEPFGKLENSFFDYDGELVYDKLTNTLLYITLFANRIVAFDTNFNLKYIARTIDTVSQPLSNAEKLGAGITHGSPPVHVNNDATSDGQFLYVYANLQADNEKGEEADASNRIDLYGIGDGRYKGSFYLPKYKGDPLITIRHLKWNTLLAMHKKQVIKYTLNDFKSLLQ